MIPQLHFDVPLPPPVMPAAGEPGLLQKASPQRDRVVHFLSAAKEAVSDAEFEGKKSAVPWRLRLIVPEEDPDRRLEGHAYGLSVASAILSLIEDRGRNGVTERHLGPLNRFALIEDARSVDPLVLERSSNTNYVNGYHVSLVADGPREPVVIPRRDGDIEHLQRPHWPIGLSDDSDRFLRCLRIARKHHLAKSVVLHLNRAGGWFEFSGPAFDGETIRIGPLMLWDGVDKQFRRPMSIGIQPTYLHALETALSSGGCGYWWPIKIFVTPPSLRREVHLVGSFAGLRHHHVVTTFSGEDGDAGAVDPWTMNHVWYENGDEDEEGES